jgi:hypothetical protein
MCTSERAKHRQYEQKWKDSDIAWKQTEAGWKVTEQQLTATLQELTANWTQKERVLSETVSALQKRSDELILQRQNEQNEWAKQSEAEIEHQKLVSAQIDELRANETKLMDAQRLDRAQFEAAKIEQERKRHELQSQFDTLQSNYAAEQRKAAEHEATLTAQISALEGAIDNWKLQLSNATAEFETKQQSAQHVLNAERTAFEEKFATQNVEWNTKFTRAGAGRQSLITAHQNTEQ